MKESPVVGVRELRTHLSAYLRAVAHGTTVTLADLRGAPDLAPDFLKTPE